MPGRVGPEIGWPHADPVAYFQDWLANDGAPFWSYRENVRNWWVIKDLPSVLFVHFADIRKDVEGEIRCIAAFIGEEQSDWSTAPSTT